MQKLLLCAGVLLLSSCGTEGTAAEGPAPTQIVNFGDGVYFIPVPGGFTVDEGQRRLTAGRAIVQFKRDNPTLKITNVEGDGFGPYGSNTGFFVFTTAE